MEKGKQLLPLIDQPQKTVAIHAILTKVFEQRNFDVSFKSIFKIGEKGDTLYNDITGNQFHLNKLTWNLKLSDPPKYSIDTTEIVKIRRYWSSKFHSN